MDRQVEFQANGKVYALRYTFRAFRRVWAEKGLGIKALCDTLDGGDLALLSYVFGVGLDSWRIHAAARANPFTDDEVLDILDALPQVRITQLVAQAIQAGACEAPKAEPGKTPAPSQAGETSSGPPPAQA